MTYKKVPEKPVEKHTTAAWSNVEETDELSNIAHPSLLQVVNAKEYVDSNEK